MMRDRDLPRGIAGGEISVPVLVHFDGSCQPPGGGGVAGWGYVIEGPGLRFEDCGLATRPYSPHSTNNVAEYVGAIRALEQLQSLGYHGDVLLEGDSQLVVRQMTGEYRVREEHLIPYHERLEQLVARFPRVTFRWIPRDENQRADALSKRAIERAVSPPLDRRSARTARPANEDDPSSPPTTD
jgi:ribonuclease HI